MASSPPPRRFWPQRWAGALRDRLQFLRLLTLLLALVALFGSPIAFGFSETEPAQVGTTLVATLALSALWIHGYRQRGLSLAWLPLELTLLALYGVGVSTEFRPFAVTYLALQHRAMFGTRRSTIIVAVGYGVVFVTMQLLRFGDVDLLPGAIALQVVLGGFDAYIFHTLAEVIARDVDRTHRLLRSEERYRALFDNSPWPMWVYDPRTLQIVDVNQSATDAYGYTRDEFVARTVLDLRPEEERETFRRIVEAAGGRRTTNLVRHRRKGGEVIDVEVTGHPVELDGRELRLAVGVDVSARLRNERALRESEERFRSVADCLREALLITDAHDRIILANQRVRDVLGYDPEAIIGRSATDLLLPPEKRSAFRDRVGRRFRGEAELYEIELIRGDGRTIVAEVSASPYRDTDGVIIGTLGAISDITEQKRLEERVRQGTRLEAVGQLAGGVAHDFNNLLTVIKVHAELLRDELNAADPARSSVMEIERAADRAADVTGQLLAFSRKQLMQPRRVALEELLRETVPVLEKLASAQVEISTTFDGSRPTVFADPTQIENVLIALVRNACDAMPDGGHVLIATATQTLGARDLALQNQHLPAGSYTVLSVTDTGTGMEETVQQRLFEPFFTTKEVGAGSGLGLASVFGTVRQSGGYVDVRSVPGKGTTFTIYLPTIADAPLPRAASAALLQPV